MSVADRFIELVMSGEAVAVAAVLDANLDLANVADRSALRRPVLHLAAERGRSEVVELLLAAGADVDRRDAAGKTAFELAVAGGFLDVVDTLLAVGASAIATRQRLEAAITAARSRGHRAVQARLERYRPHEIESRWIEAWNCLLGLVDGRGHVDCALPDGRVVDVDACKAWLQESVYQGWDVHVEPGWIAGTRGVLARRSKP